MKQRIISALVALLIFIPLVIMGGLPFKVGITVLSLISVYEIIKLKKEIPDFIKIISYLLMILMVFINISIIIKILVVYFILMILLIFYDKEKYNIELSTFLSSLIIFLGLVFHYIYQIRENDINVLIYLFLITILTDTFAYFGGKLFGKNKLIERISPNKTIEGSLIGSLFGTIIPSLFYIYMVDPGMNIMLVIFMTLILSIIGQMGDLVFSSIKRYYKIKDFSNIMPGHGGVLDRFDSIIFVLISYIIIINFM